MQGYDETLKNTLKAWLKERCGEDDSCPRVSGGRNVCKRVRSLLILVSVSIGKEGEHDEEV